MIFAKDCHQNSRRKFDFYAISPWPFLSFIYKGIAILELGWSRNITEVDPGDNATVVFDVRVSIDPCSPDVIGAGLWQLAMFTSETEDGSIRNIHPYISQILTAEEASTPYQGGDLLSFTGVKSHPFWTEPLGCGPLKYLCLALSKGDLPSPNYDVIFPDTKQEVIHCREEACVGIYYYS